MAKNNGWGGHREYVPTEIIVVCRKCNTGLSIKLGDFHPGDTVVCPVCANRIQTQVRR